MWSTKSQFFDSQSAYGAKRSSNGRRDLPKLSSKCIPKHPKSTTKMHRSAIYTHRERENRWFHRCRKSNENLNYKIACFFVPGARIGLQWSPAPSKKYWKLIKKQQFFSRTVSGPQLGCPDELWDNLMRVWKLRSSSTTSTQQRSMIRSHRTSILKFCVPRRRHPRQVDPDLTLIEQKFFHVQCPL